MNKCFLICPPISVSDRSSSVVFRSSSTPCTSINHASTSSGRTSAVSCPPTSPSPPGRGSRPSASPRPSSPLSQLIRTSRSVCVLTGKLEANSANMLIPLSCQILLSSLAADKRGFCCGTNVLFLCGFGFSYPLSHTHTSNTHTHQIHTTSDRALFSRSPAPLLQIGPVSVLFPSCVSSCLSFVSG